MEGSPNTTENVAEIREQKRRAQIENIQSMVETVASAESYFRALYSIRDRRSRVQSAGRMLEALDLEPTAEMQAGWEEDSQKLEELETQLKDGYKEKFGKEL